MNTISYEVEDKVLTITLDRPRQLNAFTFEMHLELIEAFDRADADPNVRCVIVTGRERAFCAGMDLSDGAASFDWDAKGGARSPDGRHRDEGGLVALRIFRSTKPVLAAINGPAVGIGVTMTLPMDIRLASESARFGLVFSRRGIVPEAASSWFLPRIVGISRAAEWCYTGRVFDAQEALAAGLVRSVHPPDELLDAARAIAVEIANETSAVSVAVTRQLLWRMLTENHPMAAHRVESRALHELGRAPDAQEGVSAFLEKRPPSYTMQVPADVPSFVPWWEDPEF